MTIGRLAITYPSYIYRKVVLVSSLVVCGCLGSRERLQLTPNNASISVIRSGEQLSSNLVGRLHSNSCTLGISNPVHYWTIPFQTVFSTHSVDLEVKALGSGHLVVTATIDGRVQEKVIENYKYPTEDVDAICAGWDSTGSAFVRLKSNELASSIKNWLQENVPCSGLSNTTQGWFCATPPPTDPTKLARKLRYIEANLIRRWRRPSYQLSRKIAVTKTMMKYAKNPNKRRISSFCKLLSLSNQGENPLIVDSASWQSALCSDPENLSKASLVLGLGADYSLRELDAINSLRQKHSRNGTIALNIQKDGEKPKKIFRVKLTPQPDVVQNLVNALVTNQSSEKKPTSYHCWEPLIENTDLYETSLILGIVTSSEHCYNRAVEAASHNERLINYLGTSIASELEFNITNGYRKVLYLPKGSYTYLAKSLNSKFHQPSGKMETTGTITWGQPRTQERPIIAAQL